MRKKEVIKTLQDRLDALNKQLPFNATVEELSEHIARTDEIRNVACLLGGLDADLN